jgi:hypothetical protein
LAPSDLNESLQEARAVVAAGPAGRNFEFQDFLAVPDDLLKAEGNFLTDPAGSKSSLGPSQWETEDVFLADLAVVSGAG